MLACSNLVALLCRLIFFARYPLEGVSGKPEALEACLLADRVAHVVYNPESATLVDLLSDAKRLLSGTKVRSVGFFAPTFGLNNEGDGNRPLVECPVETPRLRVPLFPCLVLVLAAPPVCPPIALAQGAGYAFCAKRAYGPSDTSPAASCRGCLKHLRTCSPASP